MERILTKQHASIILILLCVFISFDFTLTIILSFLFLIIGIIAILIKSEYNNVKEKRRQINNYADGFRFSSGIDDLISDRNKFKETTAYQIKHAMTGSNDMDTVLEQIFQYIIRDYVNSWYSSITSEKLFQESLLRVLRRSTAAFCQCIKKVDYVPLLTRHLVDDVASHLKLYRIAQEKIALQKSNKMRVDDLETIFFDLELEMEKNRCRDLVSTSSQYESAYLHDISDILLYLLMPNEDFRSRPMRFIAREILVSKVLKPMIDKLSDPDYITYLIVWVFSEVNFNTDDFVTTIETSKSAQELEAIVEAIEQEINALRAKDSGGATIENIKQQLASLEYTSKFIKQKMKKIAEEQEDITCTHVETSHDNDDCPYISLPITVILTNNEAVFSFVDYLSEIGGQCYIDLFLSIEGFKNSVHNQLRYLANGESIDTEIYETIKDVAVSIYHRHLAHGAVTKVPLDEAVINRFLARLRNDEPLDSWFEEIQERIVHVLTTEERFYPGFKKSQHYYKMLEKLGIIGNDDDQSIADSTSIDVPDDLISLNSDKSQSSSKDLRKPGDSGPRTTVTIKTLGIGNQGKQIYAVYNVRINKYDVKNGSSSTWNVIRRYSEFYALNNLIQLKYKKLKNISFPAKKAFNNLDKEFLDKRCKALNDYMDSLLEPKILAQNPGLEDDLFDFLSQKRYTGNQKKISKRLMNVMFDPIVSGVKAFGTAVTQVPDSGFVTKVGSELNRAASVLRPSKSNASEESSRVAAALENVESENIPLRVIILFLEEVFGLRGKDQWMRRQFVAVLRQFVNALGSSINKKIIDVVKFVTSEEQVLQYLIAFRNSMWPDGHLSTETNERPPSDSLCARLFARYLMLSALPDELKFMMGNPRTISGITNISNALQNPHLNRRLVYVILERVLVTVFPNNNFEKILVALHSKSPRVKYN